MSDIDVLQEIVEEFAKKNGYEVDYSTLDKLRDLYNEEVNNNDTND